MSTCSLCGNEHEQLFECEKNKKYCKDCIEKYHLEKCSHENCGKFIEPNRLYVTRTGFLCKMHWSYNYFYCAICGTHHPKQYGYRIDGGKSYICHGCFNEKYFKCDCCGEIHKKEDVKTLINDGGELKLCELCYNTKFPVCPHCGKRKSIHLFTEVQFNNGETFKGCTNCANEKLKRCDRCGEWYPADYQLIERDDKKYCEMCWFQSGIIHTYHYKPQIKPQRVSSESSLNLLYGVENEIELDPKMVGETKRIEGTIKNFVVDYRQWLASKIDEYIPGFLYQKSDGSLNYGIEIVSHPATIEFWLSIKDNIAEMFEFLKSESCQGEYATTAGMHVHCSREGMNRIHQNCFSAFIYSNKSRVQKIAGRSSNSYSRYKSFNRDNITEITKVVENHDNRYDAVNWRNKKTVEVRIFQSTININNFLSNLEFCNSVYMFTKEKSIADIVSHDCFKNFCNYLESNNYKYLPQRIVDQGIWTS